MHEDLEQDGVIRPWSLDYGWAKRGGPWTPCSDVLLEAKLQLHQATRADVEAEILAFLEQCPKMMGRMDGRLIELYGHGGVWSCRGGYFELKGGGELRADGLERQLNRFEGSVDFELVYRHYFHSRGEDAFDSLHAVSIEFCRGLKGLSRKLRLGWVEHAHNRDYRLLGRFNHAGDQN